MNKLNLQNGELGDTPPIKEELETPLFTAQNRSVKSTLLEATAITNVLNNLEIPDELRQEHYYLYSFQYHFDAPVISVYKSDGLPEIVSFEITKDGLKTRHNATLKSDIEKEKQFATAVLELQIPEAQELPA